MDKDQVQQEDLNTFVTNAELDAESRAEALNDGESQYQSEEADALTNVAENEDME
ncbi:hypothetical protein [Paenibacillus sp. KN14-4R]|uniref:hypothetical protein n=1 Tax=Paenibacillus sp. KN14-4R TaxID=3445773 RepID=UPI003F9EF1B9